jgi:hypothetical protein
MTFEIGTRVKVTIIGLLHLSGLHTGTVVDIEMLVPWRLMYLKERGVPEWTGRVGVLLDNSPFSFDGPAYFYQNELALIIGGE